MKRIFYLLLASSVFMISCGDDEPTINPIVGEWVLDQITISNPPDGYAFAVSTTPTNLYGESSYEIEFFADGTYERTINTPNRFEDEGTWELSNDELELDQDETNVQGLPLDFEVDGTISEERGMTLITNDDQWFVWPPAILAEFEPGVTALDTADTQEKLNALFADYGELQTVTMELEFEKN